MAKKPIGVILTDTHLDRDNFEAQMAIYLQSIDLAKSLGLKEVWHGGDAFESRKSQPLHVLEGFLMILDLFVEHDMILRIIPGNHDKVNYDSESSYLDVFRYHPNLRLHRRETSMEITKKLTVHWLPYFLESGSYVERLKSLQLESGYNVLLTHIAVNGVRNNDGSVVQNDLDRNTFKQFDNVLVGHYHDQSSIHNVHYIGSALQKNFGENDMKGFTILYDDASHEFHRAEFVRYITIDVNVDQQSNEELEQFIAQYEGSPDHIRIKFRGEKSRLVAINKPKFDKAGIDVKFESDEIDPSEEFSTDDFVQFNKESIVEEFKLFCAKENYDNKQGLHYLNNVL